MSLGHTLIPPAADRTHETKTRLLEQIQAMLGGRAAEEVVFNEMTSGASNDIAQATKIARAMVIEFGMSDLGPINLGDDMGMGDFGQMEWFEGAKNSPAFLEKIDTEVKKILDTAYKAAVKLIKGNRKLLDKVSEALLERETLDRDDFEKIVGKKENGVK
jgi:cell division protease FtsH